MKPAVLAFALALVSAAFVVNTERAEAVVAPVATFYPNYVNGVCRVYTYYWNSGHSIPTVMEGLSVLECYQEAAELNAAQLE